ncbi:cytochrome c oxidase subunit 1, partial [Rhizophlyctis rosea]
MEEAESISETSSDIELGPEPVHMEPVVVEDDGVVARPETVSPFNRIEDVDAVLRKYTARVSRRARRLRGEDVETPLETPPQEHAATPDMPEDMVGDDEREDFTEEDGRDEELERALEAEDSISPRPEYISIPSAADEQLPDVPLVEQTIPLESALPGSQVDEPRVPVIASVEKESGETTVQEQQHPISAMAAIAGTASSHAPGTSTQIGLAALPASARTLGPPSRTTSGATRLFSPGPLSLEARGLVGVPELSIDHQLVPDEDNIAVPSSDDLLRQSMIVTSMRTLQENRKRKQAHADAITSWEVNSGWRSPLPFAEYFTPDAFMSNYRPPSRRRISREIIADLRAERGEGNASRRRQPGELAHEHRRKEHENLLVPMEVMYAEAELRRQEEGEVAEPKNGESIMVAGGPAPLKPSHSGMQFAAAAPRLSLPIGLRTFRPAQAIPQTPPLIQRTPDTLPSWYPPRETPEPTNMAADDAGLSYQDMLQTVISAPVLPEVVVPPRGRMPEAFSPTTKDISDDWISTDNLYVPTRLEGNELADDSALPPETSVDEGAEVGQPMDVDARTPTPPPMRLLKEVNDDVAAQTSGISPWSASEAPGVSDSVMEAQYSGAIEAEPVSTTAEWTRPEAAQSPPTAEERSNAEEVSQSALPSTRSETVEIIPPTVFTSPSPKVTTPLRRSSLSRERQSSLPGRRSSIELTSNKRGRARSRTWTGTAPPDRSSIWNADRAKSAKAALMEWHEGATSEGEQSSEEEDVVDGSSEEEEVIPELPREPESADPKTFYMQRRRSSVAAMAELGATEPGARSASMSRAASEAGDQRVSFALPHIPESPMTLPSFAPGTRVSAHSVTDVTGSQAQLIIPTEMDLSLGGPKTVIQALALKGYPNGHGPNMFDAVHNPERRSVSMSPAELSKYPVFNDPAHPVTPGDTFGALPAEDPQAEIDKITAMIAMSSVPIPAYLRRRGILFGRVGKYPEALNDLTRALQFGMVAAIVASYAFLETLTVLPSRCQGMIKMAVVAYSQVIKLKPDESDGYYNRACLFELENEAVYANEDFKMVRQLDPTNLHAIRNLAIYSFHRQLWDDAIGALSKLIRLSPEDAQAHSYRGRAHAFMAKWDEALEDMSTAIQLSPDKPDVFFHRAALLRERNPIWAIEDYSISILLDDSPANIEAFYQRAMLYYRAGQYDLAIADYLTVIELDPAKWAAHLNLGILYMKHMDEFDKSQDCFNKAIAAEPTQIRIYLCRGDLYQMLHHRTLAEGGENVQTESRSRRHRRKVEYIDMAIQDYGRAIHLNPGNYMLYLYRGRILLKQGRMKEATYDFQTAFELNADIAQTFMQRKYQQIISEYTQRSRFENLDDPALLMLTAKARVKCGDNYGALKDLERALDHSKKDPQIYLQRGICYENLKDWTNAAREFSNCLALNAAYAKAYYHRGLCKLHEGNEKGVADLDKALNLDPRFFDAYLTRASFFHVKGNYAEGVNDCNEALLLEPTSLRAHLLRGACRCKLHQFTMAIADFTRAINLDKGSHHAFYNRAVTYQLMNESESAIRDYSIVLLLHDDSNAYRNRGLLYWKQGDAENALLDLFAARKYFPEDARLHGLLALCLQRVGRIEESINAFTSAIRVNPYLSEAYLGRGNVHAQRMNTRLARMDYGRVIHMYPRCTEAYVNMAYTLQMEGRYKKAWEILTMALAVDPLCTPALEGRSVIHFAMNNPFGALIDIRRAIA